MQQQPQQQQQVAATNGARDDFSAAVLLTFDPLHQNHALRAQAQQYCDSIRSSPDGWRFCLAKFHEIAQARGDDQVLFWCLLTCNHVIDSRYQQMSEDDKNVMRRALMLYIRDIVPTQQQSSFIKNKVCILLVKIVKHDYPKIWASFFSDFLSLLTKGPEVIDVFVRLLKILDEEVVETDSQRTGYEHLANTAIKDSMRENDLKSIVDAMYSICELYYRTHPLLVANALESFAEYIEWIDINLVVNERFLTLFYAFMAPAQQQQLGGAGTNGIGSNHSSPNKLALPSSSSSSSSLSPSHRRSNSNSPSSATLQLQIHSTNCMIEIIAKRMDDKLKKFSLIKTLRILDFLTHVMLPNYISPLFPKTLSQVSHPSQLTEEDNLVQTCASLIESIGSSLIGIVEKLTKSLAATNNPQQQQLLTQDQLLLTQQSLQESLPLLQQTLQLAYIFFEHPLYSISKEVLPMLIEFVTTLLKKPGPWSAMMPDALRSIFKGLTISASYPTWYKFDAIDDEEQLFLEHRSSCIKLFTNLTLTNPQIMVELLAGRLAEILNSLAAGQPQLAASSASPSQPSQPQQLSYQSIEVILKLLYEMAVTLKINQRTTEEPFRSMFGSFFSSSISTYPHPQVTNLYFELVVRYVKFFDTNPGFIGPILQSFLDARGMRSTAVWLRNRCCYLFFRFITNQDLSRKQLQPYVDQTIKEVQSIIEMLIQPGKESMLEVDWLCEVLGCLSGSPVVGVQECHRYVAGIFAYFKNQIESILNNQAAWYPHDSDRAGIRLGHLIEAISSVMNQLGHQDGGKIQDLLLENAQLVLRILTILPTHSSVITKTLFFMHRIVDCQPNIGGGSGTTPRHSAQQGGQNGIPSLMLPATAASPSPSSTLTLPPQSDPPIMQFFSLTLSLMLKHSNPSTIQSITEVIIQVCRKFKKRFEGVLDVIFLPMCQKIFECLQSYDHVDQPQQTNGVVTNSNGLPAAAYSTEKQERLALQQKYYEFLKHIVQYDLVGVFASPTNSPHIRTVLNTVLRGCLSPPDCSIHSRCFQLLRNLVQIWSTQGVLTQGAAPGPQLGDTSLKHFVQVEITTHLYQAICSSHFALSDPGCISAVRDLIELQKTIYLVLGEEYLKYLHQDVLQNMLGFSSDVAKEYCMILMNYQSHNNQAGSEWKQFEKFFRALQERSQQQNQQQQQLQQVQQQQQQQQQQQMNGFGR